jgi:hypothetical protein
MSNARSAKEQFLKDNMRPDEDYAGILLGENGAPDSHLFVSRIKVENSTFQQVLDIAKKHGYRSATLRELGLIRVNQRSQERFKSGAFWSCEQSASYALIAWIQYFYNGVQDPYGKNAKLSGVLVRSLEIL